MRSKNMENSFDDGNEVLGKTYFPRSEVAEISCGAETTGGKIKEKAERMVVNDEVFLFSFGHLTIADISDDSYQWIYL